MKTELRLSAHTVLAGEAVIELWHNGVFIGTVVGADGPGVRVVSKYQKVVTREHDPLVTEVAIIT